MENIRCLICDTRGKWKNVDQYRIKKEGMCMCESCGFVTYPERIGDKQGVIDYYKKEYRQPPTAGNLYSGQRKLHYHAEFLQDHLKTWRDKDLVRPVVCDVGAAYGIFLHWIQTGFPEAQLNGVELTTSYKRVAHHEFGIDLVDEFDKSKKYDLICSYKSAEHIIDADQEIEDWANALNDDGVLYISVPCWFGRMHNFGAGGWDIEYYYHTNHINVWTREQFETILARKGLKIIKEDHDMYDDTYLCVKTDEPLEVGSFGDPKETEANLKKIYAASVAFDKNDFDAAIQSWPDFPQAHKNNYEMNRAAFHKRGLEWLMNTYMPSLMECCPGSFDAHMLCTDILMRYEQYEKAINMIDKALKLRPRASNMLGALADCFRNLAKKAEKEEDRIKFLKEACEVTKFLKMSCAQSAANATTAIYADYAELPTPSE